MSLEVRSLDIPDVKIISPKKHGDLRGFFSETYNKRDFAGAGIQSRLCSRQSLTVTTGRHSERPSLSGPPVRTRQARSRCEWPYSRRGGRLAARFANIWELGDRGNFSRRMESDFSFQSVLLMRFAHWNRTPSLFTK